MSKMFEEITESSVEVKKEPIKDVVLEKNPFMDIVPLKLKEFPSNGLFYPKGTSISYRLYSLGELKRLAKMTVNVQTIKTFVDVCLQGIYLDGLEDKYEMCYSDFIFLLVMRKFPSLAKNDTDPYVIKITCNKCEEKQTSIIKLEDIGFNDISSKEGLSFDYKGETINFKPLTIKKWLELVSLKEEYGDLDEEILAIAACIDKGDLLENYKMVNDSTDKSFIKKVFEMDEKLDLRVLPHEVICNSCGNKNKFRLDTFDSEYTLAFPCLL